MCSPPSIGSTSSNYTLDCVVTAPGLEPQAVQHKGMAPVDKWPRLGVDLPIVVDRRHPSRFIIKWDRIEKDPLEDWIAGRSLSSRVRQRDGEFSVGPPRWRVC
jgi:hypothetical protein